MQHSDEGAQASRSRATDAGAGPALPHDLLLDAILANSLDITVVTDASGTVRWVSASVEAMLGHRPEDLVGADAFDLIEPDDVDEAAARFAEVAAGDAASVPLLVRVRHRDGSSVPVEALGTLLSPVPGTGEATEPRVVVSLRDARPHLAAERGRRLLTDIFELTTDLVGIADPRGEARYLNQAARRFFGLDGSTALSSDALLGLLTPAGRRRLEADALPALAQGRPWSGELAVRRADGVEVPMEAQLLAHHDATGRMECVSGVFRDISEHKALERRLEHAATHDPLTGLPNRALLLDRLEHALARSRRRRDTLGVLFCDLDHFKFVNDSRGHSTGDRLLADIARRIEAQVRPGDTVSRFGGDEFVLLCESLSGAEDAALLAERVLRAISRPFPLDAGTVHVGASIGIALAHAGRGDAEALVREADAAMYRAKGRGRGRVEVFEPAMWDRALDRFDLENGLRRAIDRGELALHYQPIVDLRSDRPCGVEALLRWHHPDRGLLLPGAFIGMAEETGLIVDLGSWVLREACRQLESWQREPGRPSLAMSVNLSARQLDDAHLVEVVEDAVRASRIDPAGLVLELTESAVMSDAEHTAAKLARLKRLGVGLAVDDFGTGYSSLSYLRRFPVDHLKVDRTFVGGLGQEQEDTAIVAAVINLAHTLGLRATAEGVETDRQRSSLRQLGCDRAQGYLWARPAASAQVEPLLV